MLDKSLSATGPEEFGAYQLLRRLAMGGMAEIYLAKEKDRKDELIVLKRLLPHISQNIDLVNRFLDEARLVATLEHPNIVDIYNVGSVGDQYFLSMEYLRGVDLRQVCRRLYRNKRKLPMPLALKIIESVADALQYAHAKRGRDGQELGIVHRDVTPHNIFTLFDGQVKLVDFGVAKVANSIHKTRTGALIGKVAYMSPEQCRAEALDSRSDVFSLAIVMYEITTGRRLYNAKKLGDFEVLRLICDEDPKPPSTFVRTYPKEIEDVLTAAMHRDPKNRLTTVQFLEQLREVAVKLDMESTQEQMVEFLAQEFPDLIEAAQDPLEEESAENEAASAEPTKDSEPDAIEKTSETRHTPTGRSSPRINAWQDSGSVSGSYGSGSSGHGSRSSSHGSDHGSYSRSASGYGARSISGSYRTPSSAYVSPYEEEEQTGVRSREKGVRWTRAPLKPPPKGGRDQNKLIVLTLSILVALVLANVAFWLLVM